MLNLDMRFLIILSLLFFSSSCELEKKSAYQKFLACMDKNLSEYVSKSTIQKSCASKYEEYLYIDTEGRAGFLNVSLTNPVDAEFNGHIINESANIILTSYSVNVEHVKNYDSQGNFLNCDISTCESFEYSENYNVFIEPGDRDNFNFFTDFKVNIQDFSEENENVFWYINNEKGLIIE